MSLGWLRAVSGGRCATGQFAAGVAVAVCLAACGSGIAGHPAMVRAGAVVPTPPQRLTAHRLRSRPGAVAPGTTVRSSGIFTDRVFTNAHTGVALANDGSAQYPVVTTDGAHWRIAGPQVHVDAADGAAGVGYVGVASSRTFFAYGSSVVDVTTDRGRAWWETYLGELVTAVVPGPGGGLVAYVQRQLNSSGSAPVVTSQYVSHDGGRRWIYSTALGGG
jgi:hypothetical protein